MIISPKVFIIQIVFLCFWNKKKDSIQSSFASFEVWTIEINYYLPRSVSENKKGEGGGGGESIPCMISNFLIIIYVKHDDKYI